jgi:hypothetical protein
MNLVMGSNVFRDVTIPVLWGTRAILQDKEGRISIIDLAGKQASLEILGDQPAPGVEFRPTIDGFSVLRNGDALYRYNPSEKVITGIHLNLPECQIGKYETRVGTNVFSNNAFAGMSVGFMVKEDGISIGVSQLPPELADLIV